MPASPVRLDPRRGPDPPLKETCVTSQRPPSITAFFPAYNDGGTIPSMVLSADLVLRSLTDDYEIVVVNDGSRDHTPQMLAELQQKYPRLRVVTHLKNRGYGGALRSGFQ